jgi:hypothetical protein
MANLKRERLNTTRAALLFVAGVVLLSAAPVAAHHAFAAEFDAKKPLKLQGTVKNMEWINPHAWIHIDVKKPNGATEEWAVEAGPPNTLFRRGFTKKSLPAGTQIVIEGYQAKDGTRKVNGRSMTFPDGRTLFLGAPGTGAPNDNRDQPESK